MLPGPEDGLLTGKTKDWDPVAYLKKRIPEAQYNRRSFDRIFYRNLLFFIGQQWVRYSRQASQWRPIPTPDWFPKQVTNKFAVACDIMQSVFLQSDPVSLCNPSSDSPEDLAASHAASDILRYIDLEVDQSSLELEASAWLALTGNFFIVDGYDNDKEHGTKFVPDYACLQCMKAVPAPQAQNGCPFCGGTALIEARDAQGQPMGKEYPIGKMMSEIASPFEIHADLVSKNLDKSPYVYRARTYPLDYLKEKFPDFKDKIKAEDGGIDTGMFYQTALAYVTNATSASPGNYGGSVGSTDHVPRATIYHLYVRPTSEVPEGAEALICSNVELWKSESTCHDEKGNPFVPITHGRFNIVPGRLFGKTPADDMVFKQVQRNKIEALIQLSMERTANSTWLLPKGIGIQNISGEPGEKIHYNAFLNGAKPERLPGAEIPGAVFRWVDALDKDIMDLGHIYDVLKGETPKGFPTLGGAQLLLERGFAGFRQALKSWGRAWTQSDRNRLNIWKEHAADERTFMVLGPDKRWEAKKLSNESIKGRVTVYLEEASLAPKSKAYQQVVTAELMQNGAIDISDPSTRTKVLHLFDVPEMVEGIDLDIKDAAKEKEEFLKTGRVRPRPGIDNDTVHAMEHIKDAKSDDFMGWPPQLQQLWTQHIQYHNQRLAEAQQQQQSQDPHVLNAQARLMQIELEVKALRESKNTELQHLAARKKIDLQAHAIKKGMDVAFKAREANSGSQKPPAP